MRNLKYYKMKRRTFIKKGGLGTAGLAMVPLMSPVTGKNTLLIKNNHGMITERPVDNGQALVNPYMGYTGYYYSHYLEIYGARLEPSDALQSFPGESVVYLRVTWAQLEPEEGKFNWTLLDTPAQRWIDAGKQCAFRVSCHETGLRHATPEWVKDAGARGYNIDAGGQFPTRSRITTEKGHTWEPAYDDPVFLEKLENFLMVMAERYDNNPNVAFMDIGSYGTWGEGHTVHASRIDYPFATFKAHIDLHCKYFKNTQLCISDDVDGWNNTNGDYPIMDYARSRGVSMRDDSVLSPSTKDLLYYHGDMAQRFWPTLPVIMEHAHYAKIKERGSFGKNGENIIKAVEDYHATYLSIHYWPYEYLEDNREIIHKINQRLGDRLQLNEISYPGKVRIGEPFTIKSLWSNAAVAPCYKGGYPCFTIKDDKGGIVSTHVDRNLNVKDLKVAAPGLAEPVQLDSEIVIAMGFREVFKGEEKLFAMTANPGDYDVYASVGKLDGTPVYRLPYDNEDGHRRYRVGSIKVENRI
jgi:hypothetical protein